MSLLSRFRHVLTPVPVERGMPWPIDFLTFGGMSYPLMGLNQTMPNAKQEDIDGSFRSFASAYRGNAIVFAVMNARMRLFTEARFQFRTMRNGKPGDLFGTADLAILETPWTNATTGDLLARMIADADLAGNFYGIRRPGPSLQRLQPDWVSILVGGTSNGLDAHIAGYAYQPGGPSGGQDRIVLLPEEVCHFAPIPDPMARYRGMSWLSPIVRELQADNAATAHKLSFFENGATPNLVVKRPDEVSKEVFEKWVQLMEAGHAGAANAYKTLYLTSGADATVVGANLRQLDFKNTQGAGETRIAAAGGVPPIIVGLSEGLAAATYSNYGQARRAFSDGTMRPLWRNAAGSLASIITVPPGAELWYDDRNIPFLAEDQKDIADIQQSKASTITNYITAGFEPDWAVKAAEAANPSLLVGHHTGLYSVQLQPPGKITPPVDPNATPMTPAILPTAPAPTGGKP